MNNYQDNTNNCMYLHTEFVNSIIYCIL